MQQLANQLAICNSQLQQLLYIQPAIQLIAKQLQVIAIASSIVICFGSATQIVHGYIIARQLAYLAVAKQLKLLCSWIATSYMGTMQQNQLASQLQVLTSTAQVDTSISDDGKCQVPKGETSTVFCSITRNLHSYELF